MTSRRLLALMCAAVLGVLLVVGLVVWEVAGPWGAGVYAVLAMALVVAGAARGRRLLEPPLRTDGRTCSCCTTSQLDPVTVIE